MPSFDGATGWLNSEPLGLAELRGSVVLVNFWTLTCINWLRQEPYVRAWSQAYRDDGLVVIGVSTPEFSFEHEIDLVRQAVKARDIDYPIVLDNDYGIWSAFDNHYWPASTSSMRRAPSATSTSAKDATRNRSACSRTCSASSASWSRSWGSALRLRPTGQPADAGDVSGLRARRAPRLPGGEARDDSRAYRLPEPWASTSGPSPASGRSGVSGSCSTSPAEASPSGSTRATRTLCSLPERASRLPSACSSTASLRGLTRRGRRRGRERCAPGRPPLPARARARRSARADAGDHVPRARRRGVRVHVRVTAEPARADASRRAARFSPTRRQRRRGQRRSCAGREP